MAAPLQTGVFANLGTPAAQAFGSAVTAGSTLWVGMRFNGTVSATSCSDNINGAWTQLGTQQDIGGISFAVYYKENASAGTPTLTLNGTGASAVRAEYAEYGGMAAASFDKTAQATGTSTTPSSGTTANRTQAAEVLLGFVGTVGGNTFTAGTNFTLREPNSEIATQIEDQTVAAAGTDAATFTLGSSQGWACWIGTFKLSGGGGATFGNFYPGASGSRRYGEQV